MLLQGKTAVIYGGGGSVGGAIARAFARYGASVHLAGRTESSLRSVADDIIAKGGAAQVDVVDALDGDAVDAHMARVVARDGRLDASVNVISDQDVQGTPMVEMDVEDYLRPVATAVRSKFLTARAAARVMVAQQSGVILYFGGRFDWTVARKLSVGGIGVTFDAVESMRRQLAGELGRHGVRVVTLHTGGLPETIPAEFDGRDEIVELLNGNALTGQAATLQDVGEIAAFAVSDLARTVSGASINMSAGAAVD
jgi:3-oxoacyl-[acyl-carrier protein] reductase